ncbi:MAG: tetratricopeptide repeat protein [Candidatus Pacebacteria bacterium]|nr:tetratricopeptide repeat protein [Candidatus Paceibacterota bacterium]
MISPIELERKQYAQPIRGETDPEPSYVADDMNLKVNEKIANKVAKNQWKFVRLQVKSYPSSRTFIQDGDLYLLKGNYRRSIKSYLEAIKFNNDILAYERIATAYITHNRFQEADTYFKKLLTLVDKRIDILKKYIGFRLLFLGQLDIQETIAIINELIAKYPGDYEAYNYLGFISLVQDKLNEAQNYFEQSLKIKNDFIHALNNMGVLCMVKNDFEKAESFFRKVIESQPLNYPFAYQNLASEKAILEDYNSALNILEMATKKGVALENNWDHMVGWLMIKLQKYKDAKRWYLNKITLEPKNDLLYNNLGVCFQSMGELEEAKEYFSEAISIFKGDSHVKKDTRSLKAFYNLARLAVGRGDIKLVETMAKDVLRLNPDDAYGLYFSGVSYVMKGEYHMAEQWYKKAFDINRNIPEMYPDYAFILESINRDSKAAIILLNEGIKRGFKTPLILNNLAYAYIVLGKLKKAERIINSAIDSKNPILLATKGLLEMRKNHLNEGNKYYKMAINSKIFSKFNKNIARQILAYENAFYWFRKKDLKKAKYFICETKKYGETYFSKNVEELNKNILSVT